MSTTLQRTIDRAVSLLRQSGNRSDYAEWVIRGACRWSGSDLKGKAKKYGSSYAHQRKLAQQFLHDAGGRVVEIEGGLRVSAVRIDHGVWETPAGIRYGEPRVGRLTQTPPATEEAST